MGLTYGTDNAFGVPVTVQFSFDGTSTPWGTANLYTMAPLSNRAESIDGSYEISDLSVELIDTNGSIWGTLGNGTGAFNKEFSATVYIGGAMDYSAYGPSGGYKWKLQNTNGAATFTVHQGRITNLSKSNRKVSVKSQNNLRLLGDLEWRFPFGRTQINPYKVGTYLFTSYDFPNDFPDAAFNMNEEGDQFEIYAACGTQYSDAIATYIPIAGRGTMGLRADYYYYGSQFYADFPRIKFRGTWIGTYVGTIQDDAKAQQYGYADVTAAQAARTGTRYIIERSRLHVSNGSLPVGTKMFLQQNLTLSETPAYIFQELLTGHCVTPYFGTEHIEPASFATSVRHSVFQAFSQRIDPKGGKVLPYIKDLIDSVYGLFAVNTQNQFEFRAYGPRNLQQTIGTLDGTNILSASFDNDFKNAKNRITVDFGHSFESGEYQKQIEVKNGSWNGTTDNPFVVQSKWLQDPNEVLVFAQRLLARYQNSIPNISVDVPLNYAGIGLGSLFHIVDADSGMDGKVMEITSYSKDFTDGRMITFSGVDGDSVYNRKGFGFWMGGTNTPSGNVSGTSTLGWGTAGTTAGINSSFYGSTFVWW